MLLLDRSPPSCTLFPYTTLFRSEADRAGEPGRPRADDQDADLDPLVRRVGRRADRVPPPFGDRKSTRLNSSHEWISYAVFCLKKKRTSASETPICYGYRYTQTRA